MLTVASMSLGHYVVYYAILLACGLACAAKGKYRFTIVGIVLPFFWIVGAARPAKSGSLWARARYTYFAREHETRADTWQ
jgi:hypothetical protein